MGGREESRLDYKSVEDVRVYTRGQEYTEAKKLKSRNAEK